MCGADNQHSVPEGVQTLTSVDVGRFLMLGVFVVVFLLALGNIFMTLGFRWPRGFRVHDVSLT